MTSLIDQSASVDAVSLLGHMDRDARGAVYTRSEVVEFILDLVGYCEGEDLVGSRILEPSCGSGDFLQVIVERLLNSAKKRSVGIEQLGSCIRAVDIGDLAIVETRQRVAEILKSHGASAKTIESLLDQWIVQADFLLSPIAHGFTHVVGNPPYIRQEALPKELLELYRKTYSTMYDRADIYVPFIERSLSLLSEGGKLGFICSDRWMKNRYGGPLRELVSNGHHLECHVDMTGCPAFDSEVIAYPAVTIISKTTAHAENVTRSCYRPKIEKSHLTKLVPALLGKKTHQDVHEAVDVVQSSEPWLLDNFKRLNVIRKIEQKFGLLEAQGCKVGIGVATGVDKVYIGTDDQLPVEPEAKLPLVTTKDLKDGEISWQGRYVLNPFQDDGALLELDKYPKFASYLSEHEERIRARNVAKKNPQKWYRTIDRIYPSLLKQPKLLIPDIKGSANVVYDKGDYYPHHNLYFITSTEWDIRALQAVLLSKVAHAFVATYSLKMRGDCLRFQAQYLRRIRLPSWDAISIEDREGLRLAAESKDQDACDRITKSIYQLSDKDWATLA